MWTRQRVYTMIYHAVATPVRVQLKGAYHLLAPQGLKALPPGVTICPVEYEGSVTLEIRGDSVFEEFLLGSRILSLEGFTLQNVPKRWRLPAGDWEDVDETAPETAVADPNAIAAMCDGKYAKRSAP